MVATIESRTPSRRPRRPSIGRGTRQLRTSNGRKSIFLGTSVGGGIDVQNGGTAEASARPAPRRSERVRPLVQPRRRFPRGVYPLERTRLRFAKQGLPP